MFCARVIRTPKRFECSTGSNISTSTPVSAAKLRKPDEPIHSPIEKSNDNSKDFQLKSQESGGLISDLPFSPLAGGNSGSYLRSKRVLNLLNKHSTLNDSRPIVSHHVSSIPVNNSKCTKKSANKSELHNLVPDKVKDVAKGDVEEQIVKGIRSSPRNHSKTNQSKIPDRISKQENKENEKLAPLGNKATTGRGRTKSNIPMRRKSVSLQELATLGHKKETNVQGHKAVDKTKINKSLERKINLTKNKTEKVFEATSNEANNTKNIKTSIVRSKSDFMSTGNKEVRKNSLGQNNAKNTQGSSERISTSNKGKKEKNINKGKSETNVKPTQEDAVKDKCSKTEEPQKKLFSENKVAKENVESSKISETNKSVAKKQSETDKLVAKKQNESDKPVAKKQNETDKPVAKKSNESDKPVIKKQNETDKPVTKNKKSSSSNSEVHEQLEKISPTSIESIIGAKIFNHINNSKQSEGVAQENSIKHRDSCGSQRLSDINASSKTSFVKRKLYSQSKDFNNDSDSNQDTSFLAPQDNIRNVYCIKKKNTSSASLEPKNSTMTNLCKSVDNQRTYTLRNNKNIDEDANKKDTCSFVTKILEAAKKTEITKKTGKIETLKSEDDKKEMENQHKNVTSDISTNEIFDKDVTAKKIKTKQTKKVWKPTKRKSSETKAKTKEKKKSNVSTKKPRRSSTRILNLSNDLVIAKSDRNAKKSALDKIHDWSGVIKRKSQMNISREKNNKKIVVNKEYVVQCTSVDPNVSLSPHIRKALSKLKEQHMQSSSSKKPVRRSLQISLNRKKAIVTNDSNVVTKKYAIQGTENTLKNRCITKDNYGGQLMAFKNGQFINVQKETSNGQTTSLDDSLYELTGCIVPRKQNVKCQALPEFQRPNTLEDQKESLINKYSLVTSLWKDPHELELLRKYSDNHNDKPTTSMAHHLEINKTFICPTADVTRDHSRQMLVPYNSSMHAVVPRRRHQGTINNYNGFKMPMGNFMPGVSHKKTMVTHVKKTTQVINRCNDTYGNTTNITNRSIMYSNPLMMSTNKQIHHQNTTIPDYIKYPSYQTSNACTNNYYNPVKNSYSIISKGNELKNRCDNVTTRYGNEIDREQEKRKRKYMENVNDFTLCSKKTKYDDEMSLCSTASARPVSSTMICANNTRNHMQNQMAGDQSVCRFIIRGPLNADNNTTNVQVNKPNNNIQIISATKHTIIQHDKSECSLSDGLNETVVSAQTYRPTRPPVERHSMRPVTAQSKHSRIMQDSRYTMDTQHLKKSHLLTNETTQNSRLTMDTQSSSNKNINKKYKFSSDDVYNFGKKPIVKDVQRNDNTFYFKGLYNEGSDISGIQTVASTTSNVDNTFRKPTALGYKKTNTAHDSSIMEKYHNLHTKTPKRVRKTPKKPTDVPSTCNALSNTPVSNNAKIQTRNLVSPWRLL